MNIQKEGRGLLSQARTLDKFYDSGKIMTGKKTKQYLWPELLQGFMTEK